MPYITKEKRAALVDLESAAEASIQTPGELNFCLTAVIMEYKRLHGLSYQTINDILGALEGAKLEFYRRVAVPYENAKMAENGDVYD
jgi:hypothetical protein